MGLGIKGEKRNKESEARSEYRNAQQELYVATMERVSTELASTVEKIVKCSLCGDDPITDAQIKSLVVQVMEASAEAGIDAGRTMENTNMFSDSKGLTEKARKTITNL